MKYNVCVKREEKLKVRYRFSAKMKRNGHTSHKSSFLRPSLSRLLIQPMNKMETDQESWNGLCPAFKVALEQILVHSLTFTVTIK